MEHKIVKQLAKLISTLPWRERMGLRSDILAESDFEYEVWVGTSESKSFAEIFGRAEQVELCVTDSVSELLLAEERVRAEIEDAAEARRIDAKALEKSKRA